MMPTMSPTAHEYVRSVNDADPAAFHSLFADGAEVNDAGRQLKGKTEIIAWSNRDIFDAKVTFEVLDVAERGNETILRTKVDGNFDRTGLPDPVLIDQHFQSEAGKIVTLTCMLVTAAHEWVAVSTV
jgi:hypothetical protein